MTQPQQPRFQFSLRTLLLLFVVLGSSLAVFGAWGIAVFIVVVGLAVYLREVKSLWSLIYLLLVLLCLACLWPAVSEPREPGARAECLYKLHQIASALQNYHAVNGCFPPAYVADKNGKPMHSWRVLILPYLDCNDLCKTYDFNEPWDGPNNKKLLASHPSPFVCPRNPSAGSPGAKETNYVAVVGPNAAFTGDKSKKLADFGTDVGSTIMLVEVADSGILWTEPKDLSLDTTGPDVGKSTLPNVSNCHSYANFFGTRIHRAGASVAMADGSVTYVARGGLSIENLRKILRVGEFKPGLTDSYEDSYRETWHLNWPNIAALAVWLLSVGTLLTHAVRNRKLLPAPPLMIDPDLSK